MWGVIKLAGRNLFRQTRRTIITLLAIAGGLSMMLLSVNVNEGVHVAMLEQGISKQAGHVVIQAEGWQDDREAEQVVPDHAAAKAALQAAAPDATVLSRAFLGGLVTSSTNAVGIAAMGVEPSAEAAVTDWDEKIKEGAWLSDDDDRGIVLGHKLADALGVDLGDKVVLMVQGPDDVESRLFRVAGTMATGSAEMDGFYAVVHLEAAQELLLAPGGAHQVSAHIPGAEVVDDVAAAVQAPAGTEALTWQQAVPELVEFVKLDESYNHGFMFIIGIIVTIGVLNTVLMSVLERIREFGVMLAVGMTPLRVAVLVLTEGLILGTLGAALGFLAGTGMSYPLVTDGLDYTEMLGAETMDVGGVTIDTVFYAIFDWEVMAVYAAMAVGFVVLSSIYPAIKAAGLKPVDAMRHI